MNVTYTQEEANAAIQLYDLAVKANGLAVSEVALYLTKKLQEAAKDTSETVTPETEVPVAEVVNEG